MNTLYTLRLSSMLPGSLKRFAFQFGASPYATTLSIGSMDASSSTVPNLGQFGISNTSLDSLLGFDVEDKREHATGEPLQYGPTRRTVWFCCNCGDGPYGVAVNTGCAACGHVKDAHCTVTTT